jgi:hypothetical protein
MDFRARGFQIVSSIAALCVLAAAVPAHADDATQRVPSARAVATDLAGRWEGRTYELARRRSDCNGAPCTLTLDLAPCGSGWCGVEVIGAAQRCGATALKLDGGEANPGGSTLFKGKLELAAGTEPYVVEVYLVTMNAEAGATRELQIAGDTGGAFRMFRRSFPFNATLAQIGEAKCRPETSVSSLME